MNVDLRSVSSDTRLDNLIFKNDIFINWMNGEYDLYLFLDSLNEGLLQVGTLAEILIENFKEVDISRLKLRVACRTGVLPSTFETELKSLSKKGCPYDNAVAEAEYKIIKTEFAFNRIFNNLEELKLELRSYVLWYNNKRIHSSLNYMTLVEYRLANMTK